MNSTKKRKRTKPNRPRADFPLLPHATGRWVKNVKGKLHYFGHYEDPDGALRIWPNDKDDILAGNIRRSRRDANALTLAELVDACLDTQKGEGESGEMAARTFWGDFSSSESILKHFARIGEQTVFAQRTLRNTIGSWFLLDTLRTVPTLKQQGAVPSSTTASVLVCTRSLSHSGQDFKRSEERQRQDSAESSRPRCTSPQRLEDCSTRQPSQCGPCRTRLDARGDQRTGDTHRGSGDIARTSRPSNGQTGPSRDRHLMK